MATNSAGKRRKYISTTVDQDVYGELQKRQKNGGWRSIGAYARAILEHHVQTRQTLREQRRIYPIPDHPPGQVAESPDVYDPQTTPRTPDCCPLARAVTGGGNGGGH